MRWHAPILLFLALGSSAGADSEVDLELDRAGPLEFSGVDFLRVDKSERRLELWRGEPGQGGRLLGVIEGIQLGANPVGPKRFQGDRRTPEGRYTIDWGNPRSLYHLSLHISYPDADDTAYAQARGRSAGGMIMIHGQPNGWEQGRVPGDWTDGCIALSNAQIEALWEAVPDGTPIEIQP